MTGLTLILLDESLMPIDIVQEVTSLIWQQCYYNIGTYEIYSPYSKSLFKACLSARFVFRTDKQQVGYIETVKETVQNGKSMLLISGYLIEGVMQKRVFHPVSFGGLSLSDNYLSTLLSHTLPIILNKATVTVKDISTNKPYCAVSSKQQNVEYFSSVVYSSLQAAECSLSHKLIDYGKIEFSIYQGLDRTITQNVNTPKLYSENMGNITNVIYKKSEAGSRNVVIVTGIIPQNVDNAVYNSQVHYIYNPDGIDIKNDLSSNHIGIIRDVILSEHTSADGKTYYSYEEAQTMKYFKQEAETQIVPPAEAFSAEILDFKDLNLGDIVTLRDESRGTDHAKRIASLVESFNPTKNTISVVFGEDLKTSNDILRKSIGLR